MMSLNKVSLTAVVKQQLLYKMKAYKSVYTTMILIQLIAFVFSIGGVGSSGGGSEFIIVNITYIGSDMIIIFTMMWAFIIATTITRKENQLMDVSFVTTPITSHLSNLMFIILMSLIGAASAILSGFLLKLLFIIFKGTDNIIVSHYAIGDILLGIGSLSVYLLLLSGVGYLVGALIQRFPILKMILPAIVIAALFFEGRESGVLTEMVTFFAQEKSLLLLTFKVVAAFLVCALLSIGVSTRMEVRR